MLKRQSKFQIIGNLINQEFDSPIFVEDYTKKVKLNIALSETVKL